MRDPRGRPLAPYAISRLVSVWLRGVGVDATGHQLRHWFGTRVYAASRDLRVTQEVMGHGSPVTTAGYARWSPEDARAAIESIRLAGDVPDDSPAQDPPCEERDDDSDDSRGQSDEHASARISVTHRTPAPTGRTSAPPRRRGRRRRSRGG